MARKNSQKTDTAGAIVFDSRTKAVMTQVGQDNVKEKVQAVKEVVPGKSANEIILVLQYYDYCVERTIQAYLEDGAKEALTEWHFSENKVSKQKKKKSKKSQQLSSQSSSAEQQMTSQRHNSQTSGGNHSKLSNGVVNGHTPTGINSTILIGKNVSRTGVVISSSSSSSSLSRVDVVHPVTALAAKEDHSAVLLQKDLNGDSAKPELPNLTDNECESHRQQKQVLKSPQHIAGSDTYDGALETNLNTADLPHRTGNALRSGMTKKDLSVNTVQPPSLPSSVVAKAKKPYAGLEKSIKDLHRQSVALERLQLVLNEEVQKAYKRINSVFQDMYSCLKERESEMIQEMDKVKFEAQDTLKQRQQKAVDLRVQIERAQQMKDNEVAELRSQIKQFVSDRRIDEDISRTTRFLYDSDHLKSEINKFGEIAPVNRCAYSSCRPIPPPNDSSSSRNGHSTVQPPPIPSAVISSSPNLPMQSNETNSTPPSQGATMVEPEVLYPCPEHTVTEENVPPRSYSTNQHYSNSSRSTDTRNNYNVGRRPRSYHQTGSRVHNQGEGSYRSSTESYYPYEQKTQYLGRGTRGGPQRSRPYRGGGRGRGTMNENKSARPGTSRTVFFADK